MTAANGSDPQDPASSPRSGLDIELLHSISVALLGEQDSNALYGKLVDASMVITGSQFATLQLYRARPTGGLLELLCSRGLPDNAVEFWRWVSPVAMSSCSEALRQGQRAIIPDFECWAQIAGTEALQAFRDVGIRAAQSTPLISRDGRLLGMISNQWRAPHHPGAFTLRLLDILARSAADLLERIFAEEALRSREQELARTCERLRESEQHQRHLANALRELNETLEQRVRERADALMQAEERLRQSQKMEAVGQLTGGLAHDFNNLLGSLGAALERLGQSLVDGGDSVRYLDTAQDCARRAAALTHRLLAFSRRQPLAPQAVDVSALMQGMTELIEHTCGPAISVHTRCEAGLWAVFVDVSQMESALLNLCLNARDAMPGGGQLSLLAGNRSLRGVAASTLGLSEGDYLQLSVSDTGVGMTPEVIGQAFEPFFTTKPADRGTGLGLSMVHGFARQYAGQVRIDSRLGQGTTVQIYLPRDQEQVPQVSALALRPSRAAGQTILLVEDEVSLRTLYAEVLDESGFQVIQAVDSAAALQVLRSKVSIDLLVSDVWLPGGMNGRQVAEVGQQLRPDLKTLFLTGYLQQAVSEGGLSAPGVQVLTKPFSLDTLVSRAKLLLAVPDVQ